MSAKGDCDMTFAASAILRGFGRQFEGMTSSQRDLGRSDAIFSMTSAVSAWLDVVELAGFSGEIDGGGVLAIGFCPVKGQVFWPMPGTVPTWILRYAIR